MARAVVAIWYTASRTGFAVPVVMTTVDADTILSAKADEFLPIFPGEDPLKHAGAVWMEAAESALSRRGLLAVAYGDPPDKLKTIIDFPLELLGPLGDPRDKYYENRLIKRMEKEVQNRSNQELRVRITYEQWTEIATALIACTKKTAPLLSRRIFKACDLRQRGVKGGYMDGPQAWQMALAIIFAG